MHTGYPKRILIYSHDTYGLGHLRRSLLIAEGLAAVPQFRSILIATGSPRAQAFSLPAGTDTLKLPVVVKTAAGCYVPRSLGIGIEEMVSLRSAILRAAAETYRPDVVLVDHAPAGMLGELWPLFEDLRRWDRRPRLVLGLRDVIDEPGRVGREWDRVRAWELLDQVYDRVLVYGDPAVRSTADELGLPARLPGKVVPVGYLGRSIERHPDPADPYILVTTGGGGDGHRVFRTYLSFLETLRGPLSTRSVLVPGPFLSSRRQLEIEARALAIGHDVQVIPFTDRLEELVGGAVGVISMAGYNTVVEILSAGVPALLVPRESPRREQRIRADRLARTADLEVCPASGLDPSRIGRFVERALASGSSRRPSVDLGGVERTACELRDVLGDDLPTRPTEGGGRREPAIA